MTYDEEWAAIFVDDTRQGFWAIYNDNDEGKRFIDCLTKEQAEYGAMILRAGGVSTSNRDDTQVAIEDMIQLVDCTTCGCQIFAGQADEAGRGPECQP